VSTPVTGFRRLRVEGQPRQRGVQYGQQARGEIGASIEAYRAVFGHTTGWDWSTVRRRTGAYRAPIADFAPAAMEEIEGIAEGAGVEVADILALNVRSEVMFSSGVAAPDECSAFAVLPEASRSGHTLVGQNWDWLVHARRTVVVVEARRDDGPDYVTAVEAGLLAKTGTNAAGLAVCTNTLVNDRDGGEPGVPYHVLLRRLLDCESITDAVSLAFAADKAMSANYLIAHLDGLAADLEVVAGRSGSVRVLMPEAGVLAHTNHFLSPDLARTDSRIGTRPGTLFRLHRLRAALERHAGDLAVEHLEAALKDHANHPIGVCSHGDPRLADAERSATIFSVIYDLDDGLWHLAAGSPCEVPYGIEATVRNCSIGEERDLDAVGNFS